MASNALVSILRSSRADFNARFAAARRIHPELQADAFAHFLGTAVDQLAVATEKVRADRLGEVMTVAYDAALELVGQKLACTGSRMPFIEEAWNRILPKTALVVATSPGRLIPAVCNAVHQLASTAGTRPDQWIAAMEKLAPQCLDAEAFLKLGLLCAWRAGLAHFRPSAIAAADALPEPLALAALDAKSGSSWANVKDELLANPWFDPAARGKDASSIRAVTQVGSFKGFGGLFIEPPLVVSSGERFLVRSNSECWLLTADIFGATFHRAATKEFDTPKGENRLPVGLKVNGTHVEFQEGRFEFPELGVFTSAAANETTLALTSGLTHSIVLVALK